MTIGWHFDNTYSKLPNSFKENIRPVPVKKPELILLNKDLAKEMSPVCMTNSALFLLKIEQISLMFFRLLCVSPVTPITIS